MQTSLFHYCVFNVHNINWLQFSNRTDLPGIYTEVFASLNLLTQIVNEPTYIPRRSDHTSSILDLFLTSDLYKYNV